MPRPPIVRRSPAQRPVTAPAVAGYRPLLITAAVACCFGTPAVQAQPSGAQAIHGSASLSQQGNTLVVTTGNGAGSKHSAINWQSFSVPAGSVTRFNQPSAASTSINRVVGNNPSEIFGTLSSNGKLVLVNPSGIAVGAGAVVDTAGFTASSLRMSDADALAGRLVFGDGSAGGALSVGGQIVARSGDIVLIAPNIETAASAVLQSPNGSTILAAGQQVAITGRGLEGISLQVQAPSDSAVNLGSITGDAVGIFAGTLKHSGLIHATAASSEGGKVVLKGQSEAEIGGQTTASKGSLGGQVHATAHKVKLKSGAVIDVSGANGGGEALIGGGWQGQDARVANAVDTTLEAGSTVKANATDSGNGGTVVAWSDQTTRVHGRIEAKGGANAGNGGKVETSGKLDLDARGVRVDTSAPQGQIGNWLLDPTSITITGGCSPAPVPCPPPAGPAAAPGPSIVYEADLETANTNVTITATDSIDTAGAFGGGSLTLQPNINLVLETTGATGTGINLGTVGLATAGSGTITLQTAAASQSIQSGPLTTSGANITLSSAGSIGVHGNIFTGGTTGNINISSSGTTGVYVDGGVSMNAQAISLGITGAGGQVQLLSGGTIALQATGGATITSTLGDIAVYGNVSNNAFGAGNGLQLTAGGDIVDGGLGGSLSTAGRSISLSAGGNIGPLPAPTPGPPAPAPATMNINTYGTALAAGNVSVTAGGSGGVSLSNINAYSGAPGSGAGFVGGTVNVQSNGAGPISIGSISAYGGGASFGAGGGGGNVTVTANNGDIRVGSVNASGGNGVNSSGAVGGIGGSIAIRRNTGALNLQAGSLYAEGGTGASAAIGGNGGTGGSINVTAGGGLNALFSGEGTLSTSGGMGGSSSDAGALRVGGAGGNGGAITLRAEGGAFTLPASGISLRSNGGNGGSGNVFAGNAASGGAGGNGGSILIEALGGNTADVGGSSFLALHAAGGDGGSAGALCFPPAPCPPSAVAGGAQGLGGSVTLGNSTGTSALTLGGNINLNVSTGFNGTDSNGTQDFSTNASAVSLNAGAGGISQTGGSSLNGPASPVPQPPNINAVSAGSVTLAESGNNLGVVQGQSGGAFAVTGLRGLGPVASTNGNVTLDAYAGENVTLFSPVIAGGAGSVLAITAPQININAAGAVSGTTINLNAALVDNSGTLKPGGTGAVGTLNVSGNLHMRDGSELLVDFNGASHDTVLVAGTTIFDAPAILSFGPSETPELMAFGPGGGVEINVNAIAQPPNGPYVIIPGANVTGTLPTLTGNLSGGSVRFGSLEIVVAASTPPPGPPSPPPPAPPAPTPPAPPPPAPSPPAPPAPTPPAPPPVPTPPAPPAPTPPAPPPPAPPPAVRGEPDPLNYTVLFAQLWKQELERLAGKEDIVLTGEQCVR